MTARNCLPAFGPGAGSLLLAGVLWLMAMSSTQAQSNTIDWFTISGGGGISTGGVYTLHSVIGQPAAGVMTGGNYSLEGGFLAGVGLVQMPGAPKLSLKLTNGFARVSWQLPADNFRLQKTTTLSGTPPPWGAVSGAYQTNATEVSVMEPLVPGRQFFRLQQAP